VALCVSHYGRCAVEDSGDSASAADVFVRWRTWGTEDNDWLGNELRDTEDDWLFNSEMTDDRTTQTEGDLRISSRVTRFGCTIRK